MSERLSDTAISIVNELHTERLDYNSEYIPLIDALNKLAEYEDAEEAGRLVKLPCAVGDTVYVVKSDEIKTYTISHFTIIKNGAFAYLAISYSEKGVANVRDFGKTVFLTREEAAEALKGADEGGV